MVEQKNVKMLKLFGLIRIALFIINKITLYGYCIIGSVYGIWLVVLGFSLHDNFLSVLVGLVLGPAIGGFCIFFGMPLTPYDYNITLSETLITREFINIVIPSLAIFLWLLLLVNALLGIASMLILKFQKR